MRGRKYEVQSYKNSILKNKLVNIYNINNEERVKLCQKNFHIGQVVLKSS